MADNTTLNSGSGGDTIACDDISGVKYPRSKITIGADGTNDGDVSATNPLPVKGTGTAGTANAGVVTVQGIASMTPVQVGDNSGTLTVDAPVGTPVFVRLSDGSSAITTLPVSLASVPSHAVTNAGTFAVQVDNTVTVASHAVTNAGTFPVQAAQSGTWTVLPGNTANTTAWLVTGTGGTFPVTDSGGSLTVDGTVAATQSGTWNVGTVTTVTTVAAVTAISNALPAGTNAIGKLAANSGVDIGDVDVTSLPGSAHDAGVSGNPVRTAGRARTSDYTAVANDDTADLLCDTTGKQVVMPYSIPENFVVGVTAAITGTGDTSVIAAAGAGVRNYVNSVTVTNSHATVSTVVEIKDGTTVIHRGYALAAGGGYTVTFPTPLRGTANTAINAACITTGSNVYVSASGYKAP